MNMTSLQRQMADLSKQIAELEQRLGRAAGELADLRAVVAPFVDRYRDEVLKYHLELVQVQRQIADLRGIQGDREALDAGVADTALSRLVNTPEYRPVQEQYERVWHGKHPPRPEDLDDNLPPVSPTIASLYTEIVAKLHPDLAETLRERKRRTSLMHEVDQAYVSRNEVSLRAVAEAHRDRSSLPAVIDDRTVRNLRRRAFMLEQVIARIEGQVYELRHGDIAKIRAYAEHARARGRDFISELSAELQYDLRQARQELAELQQAQR